MKEIDQKLSYLLGFLQADGHRVKLHPNNIQIELSAKDIDILQKIKKEFSLPLDIRSRIRDTNFAKNYASCSLNIHAKSIENIIEYIPQGKKSETIMPPNCKYSEYDYWRGIIDGDGSIGFRNGRSTPTPYISLVTNSGHLAEAFELFLFKETYSKNKSSKNKRDNCYNIVLGGYYVFTFLEKVYYDKCLALDRKLNKAANILSSNWLSLTKKRPFSREEDTFLLTLPLSEIMRFSTRDRSVLRTRLKYLSIRNIDDIKKLYNIEYYI